MMAAGGSAAAAGGILAGSEVRVSSFPLPPMQYVSRYTNEAVTRGQTPPPPAPLSSPYCMFGVPCAKDDQIIRSLESQGVRRVYPALFDHKRELKKLNFSILANYLDLLDIVTKDPESPKRAEKIEHLNLLFINMHHLINEYRPHQARDALWEIIGYQRRVSRQTVDTAQKYLARARDIMSIAISQLPSSEALESKLLLGIMIDTDTQQDSATSGGDMFSADAAVSAALPETFNQLFCDATDYLTDTEIDELLY